MDYKRSILSALSAYLSGPTPVIHVLIGPRQVGKTTIAHQIQETIGIPSSLHLFRPCAFLRLHPDVAR